VPWAAGRDVLVDVIEDHSAALDCSLCLAPESRKSPTCSRRQPCADVGGPGDHLVSRCCT